MRISIVLRFYLNYIGTIEALRIPNHQSIGRDGQKDEIEKYSNLKGFIKSKQIKFGIILITSYFKGKIKIHLFQKKKNALL